MLTKEEFDKILPGEVFATGVLPNSPDGLYMINSHIGEELRWVAKKGWGYDWAIYCHWVDKSVDWVTHFGNKITGENNIKKCVPCTEEMFKIYRY